MDPHLRHLLELADEQREDIDACTAAARAALRAGYWRTARRLIDAGLRLQPHDRSLLALSGYSHLRALRFVAAERDLVAAQRHGDSSAEVCCHAAYASAGQQRLERAYAQLTEPVLRSLPMALLLRARCELPAAVAAVANTLPGGEPDPEDSPLHGVARERFVAALRPHAECGITWLTLARLELESAAGQLTGEDIALASMYDGAHVGSWHVMAWLHVLRGDVAAATIARDGALALDRDLPETLGLCAVVAILTRENEQALEYLRRAHELGLATLGAHYAQFLLLERSGRRRDADAVIETLRLRAVPSAALNSQAGCSDSCGTGCQDRNAP